MTVGKPLGPVRHRVKDEAINGPRGGEMSTAELVSAGKYLIGGPNWRKPLAREVAKDPRCTKKLQSIMILMKRYASGGRRIPDDVAEILRDLIRIGPAGLLVCETIRRSAPNLSAIVAHRVGQEAERRLMDAGLLKKYAPSGIRSQDRDKKRKLRLLRDRTKISRHHLRVEPRQR
jgi:hypothetical protein